MLFRRHATAVHTFAQRRTRSADIADDITAIAFEKAWRSLDRLDDDGDRFRPWVFRIAANEMASTMRSRSRRMQREHLATSRGEIPSDGGYIRNHVDALAAVDSAIDSHHVLEALGDLPERYQEVISLRFLSELTPVETATALGVSRGNVAVLLHRAISALRRSLEEDAS